MAVPLLTEGESKAYEALVEIGESTIGNILKKSGVSHSKIYDILKRLEEKGLVSVINKNGKQVFNPAEPRQLMELANEKENEFSLLKTELEKKVKELQFKKGSSTTKSILSAYEGIKGMKTVLELILQKLEKGDEVLILGSPKKYIEQFSGYLKDWQKRRIAKAVKCMIIADYDAPSWDNEKFWTESIRQGITFTRISKTGAPAHLIITKNNVATIYFASAVHSVLVEHEEIAKRYQGFFRELWKVSKQHLLKTR
ncbi:hypothetical protein HY486_01105 [Candidatus Woesearchaeota archaeon]|nr:hypothetical protein [Candidatus Woesearchaeota archaeon]